MSLQVEVLEQSFERVKPHANEFAASFYHNLLTKYPQLQPLFAKTDMEQQHQKLIMSLVLVIGNLRNPELLKITLNNLGARHVSYGTLQQHYPMVGAALLKTFEEYLGADWTPEIKQAWADAYEVLASMMLEGAQSTEKILSSHSYQLDTKTATSTQQVSTPANVQPKPESVKNSQATPEETTSNFNLPIILLVAAIIGLLGFGFYYFNTNQNNNNQNSLLLKSSSRSY